MSENRSPQQQHILDEVLGVGQARPTFDPRLREQLLDELRHRLTIPLERIPPGEKLVVRAYDLNNIHGCELRWKQDDWDGWSVEKLTGTVKHRIIERLIVGSGGVAPIELAAQVLDRMIDEDRPQGTSAYVSDLDGWTRHDLVNKASDAATKFLAEWPTIKPSWKPRAESPRWFSIFGDDERIKLSVKCDLALGVPDGMTAKTLIVDFKTGNRHPSHCDQVRYYSLVETLVTSVPPFRVATYYLDGGHAWIEDVTETTLEVALRRLADGIESMVGVRYGNREAVVNPGPLCEYCNHQPDCAAGTTFLAKRSQVA